jgi:hypothetical protein
MQLHPGQDMLTLFAAALSAHFSEYAKVDDFFNCDLADILFDLAH